MPVVYREDPVFSNLNKNINLVGGTLINKQIKDQDEQKQIKLALQKMVMTAALNKTQLRKGADLTKLDTSKGMEGVLGQIPSMFEREPVMPQTSISISERPYTETLKAQEIANRTPAEYGKAGMASKTGGWFGNWGPGSQWKLSPEAVAEQTQAKTILGSPYRTTKRVSYKGNVVDTSATDVTADTNELPDPSEYEEDSVIEDDIGNQYKLIQSQWVKQ